MFGLGKIRIVSPTAILGWGSRHALGRLSDDNLVGGGQGSTKGKTTAAPSRARRSTTVRPILREPQVTSARFPVSAPVYAGRSRRAAARSGNTLATLAVR